MGRPSDYDPKYCTEVIDCLAEGHSITGFAGRIRKNRDTIFEWRKAHKDFDEAVKIGIAAAAYFWEQRHIEFAKDGKGNAAGIIFGLKNRASDDWSDKI